MVRPTRFFFQEVSLRPRPSKKFSTSWVRVLFSVSITVVSLYSTAYVGPGVPWQEPHERVRG